MSTKTQIQIAILIIDLVIAGLFTAFGIAMSFDLRIPVISMETATALAGGIGWLEVVIALGTVIVNILIIAENLIATIITMSTFSIPSCGNIINGVFSAMNIALILTLIPW